MRLGPQGPFKSLVRWLAKGSQSWDNYLSLIAIMVPRTLCLEDSPDPTIHTRLNRTRVRPRLTPARDAWRQPTLPIILAALLGISRTTRYSRSDGRPHRSNWTELPRPGWRNRLWISSTEKSAQTWIPLLYVCCDVLLGASHWSADPDQRQYFQPNPCSELNHCKKHRGRKHDASKSVPGGWYSACTIQSRAE